MNLKEYTSQVLRTLTPREERVIKMRFGLEDGSEHTLEEVGQSFLCHSSCRARLKKWISPLSRVSRRDWAFMYASIDTSPVCQSCTTHGTRPRSSNAICESSTGPRF